MEECNLVERGGIYQFLVAKEVSLCKSVAAVALVAAGGDCRVVSARGTTPGRLFQISLDRGALRIPRLKKAASV